VDDINEPSVLFVFDFKSVRALACVKAYRMGRNVQIPEHHQILFEGDLVIMLSELLVKRTLRVQTIFVR